MSTFGRPVVNQDRVQVVRNVAVLAEGGSYQIFFLLDLLVDLGLLICDCHLVGGEKVCCTCELGHVKVDTLKVAPDLLRGSSR